MSDQTAALRATLRRLALPIYVPWFGVAFGTAMLLPILPVYLTDLGLSFTSATVVLAATGVGATASGLPLGAALSRVGERALLVASILLSAVSAALLGASGVIAVLVMLRLGTGVGSMGMRLAQQTHIARTVDSSQRGRAMSLMGGTARAGIFVGPFVGGALTDLTSPETTFVAAATVMVAGLVPDLLVNRRADEHALDEPTPQPSGDDEPTPSMAGHWRRLVTIGIGPALITAVRSGRLIVIPLIADDLGLSATAVGAVVAIGTGADLMLFPVAGWLMDRHGRLFATVPAFTLMGIGLLLLGTVDSTIGVVIAGTVIGIGNGMSSGTMLTIGSDVAPAGVRAPFLAGLGSMQDLGRIIGPLIVGWFADAAGLDASAVALAVAMFIGVAWLILVIGETRDLQLG